MHYNMHVTLCILLIVRISSLLFILFNEVRYRVKSKDPLNTLELLQNQREDQLQEELKKKIEVVFEVL